ncbi:hypothetical protein BH11PSE11_BH11PSE11_35630 [soil metagenome]
MHARRPAGLCNRHENSHFILAMHLQTFHRPWKTRTPIVDESSWLCAAVFTLAMASCGGGGGGTPSSAPAVESTATSTPTAPTTTPPVATAPASPAPAQPAEFPAVVTAADCSYRAVVDAVNLAGPGTTVNIPPGHCNWGIAQLVVPAGVNLQGAGRDRTFIYRVGFAPNTSYVIKFDCSNGRKVVFSGISLVGNGIGLIQDKGLGLLNGCVDFKVSESRFSKFSFSGVYVGDSAKQRGVIFNNEFIENFGVELMNLGYGVVVFGGGVWPALELGSQNAVFVEDNYFAGNRHSIASNNGSVYVFRHNSVVGEDAAKDFAMTDVHGYSTSPVGSRSYEIYDNKYTTNFSSGFQRTAIGIRGGDGVIFNNTATTRIKRTVELNAEGFTCGAYPGPGQIRTLYIWNNSSNPGNDQSLNGILNNCETSIALNRDYFMTPMPGYKAFTYPHPMRK